MLTDLRFNVSQLELKNWSLLKITGEDRESFFQGQITNDLSLLKINQGQISARLNRSGKLQSCFYIAKLANSLLILCEKILQDEIKNDFEKYIIMEDVNIEIQNTEKWLMFNPILAEDKKTEMFFDFIFNGIITRFSTQMFLNIPLADSDRLEEIRILNGWPSWNKDVNNTHFINDSYLNEIAISYKKGCFLGQETASKIENNRGAAYYPVLLKVLDKEISSIEPKSRFNVSDQHAGVVNYQIGEYLQASLLRDYRVVGKTFKVEINNSSICVEVFELPFYKAVSNKELAQELYYKGIEIFQAGQEDEARSYIEKSINLDSSFADAYESLGVMLGRKEQYENAIEWMDKLLTVRPSSVMAHTNKSLYLMKLGKIEEAEAEKSLATVKSFASYGEEAKLKKQLVEEQLKKEAELAKREKMFLQVLEIDEEDTIALHGMGDILFHRNEFKSAVKYLEATIKINPKYSTAYLLLGKSYEALSQYSLAIENYKMGIDIASKRGDMMPANEMQSRLNKLVVASRLT